MLSSESGDPMYTESIVHFGSSTGPAIRTLPASSSISWGKSNTATALGSNEVSIGVDAGNAITKNNAVMIGANAGSGIAAAGQDFVLVGTDAARAVSSTIGSSVAIGHQAGESAASIESSIVIGWNVAGSASATFDSSSSVIIGKRAGDSLTANQVIAIGEDSMYLTTGTPTSTVAVGQSSGIGSTGASGVYLGKNAGKENTGTSVVAIGTDAGYDGVAGGNSLPNMFIIANTHLPSYANHAAAEAVIDPSSGGTGIPGNTYLYHNQATDSIGAVRL
jgi:co-chaperonin GroES (HSP10)